MCSSDLIPEVSAYFIAAGLAFALAQLIKYVLNRRAKELGGWRQLYMSGRMPSGHTATMTALATVVAVRDGLESGLFAVTAVIALITEWKDKDGSIQKRTESSDLGGTMRLGAQSSDVAPGTLAHQIYGDVVTERHRHRYEANVNYLDTLRQAGLVISALTQREHLTEIVELPEAVHPWYMGVQFHPEFKSTPWDGHPLFNAYIRAALDLKKSPQLKAVA